jgi:hypothetical protein
LSVPGCLALVLRSTAVSPYVPAWLLVVGKGPLSVPGCLVLVLKGTAVAPSFLPGCLVAGTTAVVCSWLFGARFEHGRFAFVRVWLFGADFEEHGRFACVRAWLLVVGDGRCLFLAVWRLS